ncbi:MAG: ABC transporter permease, partial [Acetobacteraceae bacterium]
MSEIVATQATVAASPRERRARSRSALRPPGIAGITILLLFLACAIAPGWIASYNPLAFDYRALLKPPSLAHPFGTDNFGRDLLSRVIWASRIDLQIAIFATIFPMLFGTFAGCVVGYVGGIFDSIFRRIVDVISTIPFLVLVIAIVAVLGPGLINMYLAISAAGWVVYARLVRGQVRAQRQLDYVAAGKVMGYSAPRIIFRHVLPNVAP